MGTATDRRTCFQRFAELSCVCLPSRCIDDPHQLPIKNVARPTLFGFDVRMLKFNYPPLIGLYICYVFLSVIGLVDNFLPAVGKLSFPSAVPFGFVLPPGIACATSFVGPVPDFDFSALWNHRLTASWTVAEQIGLRLFALSFDDSKFQN